MTTRNLETEFDTVKDDIGKLRADIANLSASLSDATSDTVREQLSSIRGRIDQAASDARDHGREVLGDLADHIEERPLTSILMAFGIGLLVGKLFDR
jgi:ElaB/YqjD/DUF883 family membrane-anchored ribosome-binding protein